MAINIGPSVEDTSAEARFQRAVRMYAGGPDNTHHDEIRGVVSPGVIQLKLILPELGAVWDEMPSTSRQGGGGERTNWRWPNGMSVPLEWMASLVGLLTMLKEWGAAVTMELDPDEKYPYWAQIHDNRARANSAWGAVMLACLGAGMRPGMKAPLFLPAGGPIKPPVGPPEEVHDQDYFARQQARHDAELGAAVALATKGLGHFAGELK